MRTLKIGFIGCGNMGGALIKAVAKSGLNPVLLINDLNFEKTAALSEETGAVVADKEKVAKEADYLFLGVKPQMLESTVNEIKELLKKREDRFVLVTMAAGTDINKLSSYFGASYPTIRIMPNLPVSVCEGMTLYCSFGTKESEIETFKELMSGSGKLLQVAEEKIDIGSGISGCGPAFAAMFTEALADAGVSLGLTRKDSYLLAEQMLLGSAKLLLETGLHPAVLKDNVCSPGGTTIAGVLELEKNAFRHAVSEAVIKTYEKTKKL